MEFNEYMEYAAGMLSGGHVPWLFINGDPLSVSRDAFRFELPGVKGRNSGRKRIFTAVKCEKTMPGARWNDLIVSDNTVYRFYADCRFSRTFFWPVFSYGDVQTAVRFWFSAGMQEPMRSPRGMKAFAAQVELTLATAGAL